MLSQEEWAVKKAAQLAAKVQAVNKANAVANEWHPKLIEAFRPFVGVTLEKATGGFYQKIVKHLELHLPSFPRSTGVTIYQLNSNYSLAYMVRVSVIVPDHGCQSYETTMYVGEMSNGMLKKLCDAQVRKTDYKAEDITQYREEYKAAEKAADEAKSKLVPFGEYEN